MTEVTDVSILNYSLSSTIDVNIMLVQGSYHNIKILWTVRCI